MIASPSGAKRSFALFSLFFTLSCGENSKQPQGDDKRVLRGAVVIVLDTLRADHVSSYGYERETTPSIDALADRGVRFERVVSPAPWTLPSVGALLAGRDPMKAFGRDSKLSVSAVERIRDAGFFTGAITEGGYVSEYFGMDRGFESFFAESGPVRESAVDDAASEQLDSPSGVDHVFLRARKWLEERHSKPFFLLVHTYEAHTPYSDTTFSRGMEPGRIGAEFKIAYLDDLQSRRLRLTPEELAYGTALYDGDIRSADGRVGDLLDYLDELGIADETLVVVTSDHGEELGEGFEHETFDHGHSLRDELLLAPLVLFDPTRDFGVGQVSQQVRLIDVLPTVCELLGVEPDATATGRSLVPILEGIEKGDRVAFSSLTSRGPQRISIRNGTHKLIRVIGPATGQIKAFPAGVHVPEFQLFALDQDPHETTNLAARSPEIVRSLSDRLDRWLEEMGVPLPAMLPSIDDEELRARLNTLGYTE